MSRRAAGFALLDAVILVLILAVVALFAIPARTHNGRWANQCNAAAALGILPRLEAAWRTADADGNGVADYWTRDVAGFHCLHDARGKHVNFVDLAFARADRAPALAYLELGGIMCAKQGYYYQAMTIDQDGSQYLDPTLPSPMAKICPGGPCTNKSRFGFTAFPGTYNSDGALVFIVNEDGVVWQKDLGVGAPVLDRKAAAPGTQGSGWAQFGG